MSEPKLDALELLPNDDKGGLSETRPARFTIRRMRSRHLRPSHCAVAS